MRRRKAAHDAAGSAHPDAGRAGPAGCSEAYFGWMARSTTGAPEARHHPATSRARPPDLRPSDRRPTTPPHRLRSSPTARQALRPASAPLRRPGHQQGRIHPAHHDFKLTCRPRSPTLIIWSTGFSLVNPWRSTLSLQLDGADCAAVGNSDYRTGPKRRAGIPLRRNPLGSSSV